MANQQEPITAHVSYIRNSSCLNGACLSSVTQGSLSHTSCLSGMGEKGMRTSIRAVMVASLTVAALTAVAATPAHSYARTMYTSNKCGSLTFDDVGEIIVLVDRCADNYGVVGYYSKAESAGSKAIYLGKGNGSTKTWNKSWPEGLLVKFKVCHYQKNSNSGFSCSKYKYWRA